MINGIFDSHAHYDDKAFDEDRTELFTSLPQNGIAAVVNCASDLESSRTSLFLAENYSFIYAACGMHPHEAQKAPADFIEILKGFLEKEKCVAVGEIGLDYHYDFSPHDIQLEVFEKQLILANEFDMPVVIHDREAHEDTLNLLKKYKPKGVVHCFSGSAEMAKEILKIGMYIGLGGAVTFKNAKKPCEVAAVVPDDRLLIETDCPYMTPVPHRGERNSSDYIPFTAEKLASIRNTDAQSIIDLTRRNACELFGISL
ncbi:MAG: TatD family hydrolase [Clostridia bacterium]|nr:TatD family hydrolase [Clostridia bacterium]